MRAYYFDNVEGDQRLAHDSGREVTAEQLQKIGVLYWYHDNLDGVNEIARQREYKNRDEINVTKAGLGDVYEAKIKGFFEEHLHHDEEIRYIRSGSGFFDVREQPKDEWIRIHVTPGDLIVIPEGIYHRFTLDENNAIVAMRLFKDEPKWIPHNRSAQTDEHPIRQAYIKNIAVS
ncbi:1,2-dihydroxy-3-keto-5-methylthiopentene dioxygenase [Auriculariales sp. MPI-PUGE-AT-0066]|nr:1,2-dihydroxy-3-keto-5-methylthiopentene dioxygenase [Auriculariales sp. MPI-PUGE-AT-0066]